MREIRGKIFIICSHPVPDERVKSRINQFLSMPVFLETIGSSREVYNLNNNKEDKGAVTNVTCKFC